MAIEPKKINEIREDFHRDTYWTRIYFESDDRKKESTVLVCASHEYLWDRFRARKISEVNLKKWLDEVVQEWSKLGAKVFSKKIHYDVYATTKEGTENGQDFLQNEVKP